MALLTLPIHKWKGILASVKLRYPKFNGHTKSAFKTPFKLSIFFLPCPLHPAPLLFEKVRTLIGGTNYFSSGLPFYLFLCCAKEEFSEFTP